MSIFRKHTDLLILVGLVVAAVTGVVVFDRGSTPQQEGGKSRLDGETALYHGRSLTEPDSSLVSLESNSPSQESSVEEPVRPRTVVPAPLEPGVVHLGIGAALGGKRPFPDDHPWNQPIDHLPVDPLSDFLIASIGEEKPIHPDFGSGIWNGAPIGIPYVVVSGSQPRAPLKFTAYPEESDPGPYPIPPYAPVEGDPNIDGDRHVIVVDRDNWMLYELFRAFPIAGGQLWRADNGAVFDMKTHHKRPEGWTSADAAGLPIFPGLVRYDEAVELGEINHALRFTVSETRRAYVPPASHWASRSTDPALPPMGMRVRLKKDFDISGFPPEAQVILTALKKYGMILADNGSDLFISGAPDSRWNDDNLRTLKQVKGSDFEVVLMEGLVEDY